MSARREGTILSKAGGRYRVHVGPAVVHATLRGRLKLDRTVRPLVGDRVQLAEHADESATIEAILPRRHTLRRRMPGKTKGVRDVAANVEQVIVVGAAARPAWDPRLIDRFVAVAEANVLPVVLVVNKCDLVTDCTSCAAPYEGAGYPVMLTSVPERSGLERLCASLEGRTSLFMGPTGVGKSSLLNALEPGLRLRTGDVSERTGAGRHTTVAAEMHPFGRTGFVVDTPGLRDIGLWGLEPSEVAAAFPEFDTAGPCRFDDCRHLAEPGCAVVAAAVRGAIASSRLESYRRLLEEAETAARPWAT